MSNNNTQLATIPVNSISSISKVVGNLNVDIFQKSREERICSGTETLMMEKVAVTLDFIMKDMGVRNTPDTYSRIRLAQFVVKRFGDLALSELKLAFELAVVGELNLEDKDVKHYNDFSLMYVGRILGAYRTKRNDSVQRVKLALPEPEKKPTPEELKTIHENFISMICNLFERQKAGENVTQRFTGFMYDWLNRIGLIKLNVKTKKELMTRSGRELQEKANNMNRIQRFNFLDVMDTTQVLESKKLAVELQFDKYIKQRHDIRKLIKQTEVAIQD